METTEFDRFADEYHEQHRANIAITGEAPEYFAEYKIKVVRDLARARHLAADRVLDFGSGIGNSIPHFRRHMPGAPDLRGCVTAQPGPRRGSHRHGGRPADHRRTHSGR